MFTAELRCSSIAMEITSICELLNQTFSSNGDDILSATTALDQLSIQPEFQYLLMSIAIGMHYSHLHVIQIPIRIQF